MAGEDFDELTKLWVQIDQQYLLYLICQDRGRRAEQRQKLYYFIKKFLERVPQKNKFFFPEIPKIMRRTIAFKPDFNPTKAALAWDAIGRYAKNLVLQPWRKEFHELKLYGGYYKHTVEDNLVDAEMMLELMGFYYVDDTTMAIGDMLDTDKITNVSRDSVVASVECQILREIWESLAPFYDYGWMELLEYRENNVGSAQQAVKNLKHQRRQLLIQQEVFRRAQHEAAGRRVPLDFFYGSNAGYLNHIYFDRSYYYPSNPIEALVNLSQPFSNLQDQGFSSGEIDQAARIQIVSFSEVHHTNIPSFVHPQAQQTPNTPAFTPPEVQQAPNTPAFTPPEVQQAPNTPAFTPPEVQQAPNTPAFTPPEVQQTPNIPAFTHPQVQQTPNTPIFTPPEVQQAPNTPAFTPPEVQQAFNIPAFTHPQVQQTPNIPAFTHPQVQQTPNIPGFTHPEVQQAANAPTFTPPEVQQAANAPTFTPPEVQQASNTPAFTPPEVQQAANAQIADSSSGIYENSQFVQEPYSNFVGDHPHHRSFDSDDSLVLTGHIIYLDSTQFQVHEPPKEYSNDDKGEASGVRKREGAKSTSKKEKESSGLEQGWKYVDPYADSQGEQACGGENLNGLTQYKPIDADGNDRGEELEENPCFPRVRINPNKTGEEKDSDGAGLVRGTQDRERKASPVIKRDMSACGRTRNIYPKGKEYEIEIYTENSPEKTSRPRSKLADDDSDDGTGSKTWQCITCTFLNSKESSICEICCKSKEPGNESKPSPEGGVVCKKCTLVNDKSNNFCDACGKRLTFAAIYI